MRFRPATFLRLPDAEQRPAYLAVFFIFAPIGLLLALIQPSAWGWGGGLASAVFSGALALLWAHGISNKRWWVIALAAAVPFFGARPYFELVNELGVFRLGAESSELVRRIVLAVISVVSISVGFCVLAAYLRRNERRVAAAHAELDIAKRMHADIVPAIDRRAGPARVVGVSIASSEMGGDLIDLVERPGASDVILADVSGHGVGAGLVMGMLKGAARARLLADGSLEDLARDLNRVLGELTPAHTFVTAAFMRVSRGAGAGARVEWASAGHLPILRRAADGRVQRLENQSLPLGIDPSERFPVGAVEAAPGEAFVVFTDGLTEAADPAGRQLGFDALEDIVRTHGGADPARLAEALVEAARSHAKGVRTDDQSVLVVSIV